MYFILFLYYILFEIWIQIFIKLFIILKKELPIEFAFKGINKLIDFFLALYF